MESVDIKGIGYELVESDGGRYLCCRVYIDGKERVFWKFNPFPLERALEWLVGDSKKGIFVIDGVEIKYEIQRVIKKGGGEENYLVFYTRFEGRNGGGVRYDFSDLGKCLIDIASKAKEGGVMRRR